MNRLSTAERAAIVAALVEGNSLRATARLTGTALNTVTRAHVALGHAAQDYQDRALRGLPCARIQCDEIWSFSYVKQRNVMKAKSAPDGAGDVWTWDDLRVLAQRDPRNDSGGAFAPPGGSIRKLALNGPTPAVQCADGGTIR